MCPQCVIFITPQMTFCSQATLLHIVYSSLETLEKNLLEKGQIIKQKKKMRRENGNDTEDEDTKIK